MHLNSAFTLARYLTRRGDVAEDLVQEALLRAYRSFDETRSSNVRAWLLTIVRNCFLTWKVRSRDESAPRDFGGTGASLEQDGGEAQEDETPESILIRHEDDCTMRFLIEGLPNPFREVLVLRDIEDMSYREIADITGVPMGTVMSRLARARKMFAEAWKGSQMRSPKEMLR
ncbi:MAG: sigma-70 family RNA polymerase sigma factor [Rhodomicrobium sp.]